MPPPPKYNANRGVGKVAFGFGMFGVSYLIAAVVGTSMIDFGDEELGRPLLIPVAGPFITAARAPSATFGFGMALGGVVQLAGLGLGITGAVQLGNARRNAPRLSAAPGGLQLRF